MTMRVGILAYGLGRGLTGIQRYTTELLRAFSAMKADAEFIILEAGGGGRGIPPGMRRISMPGCSRLPAFLSLGSAVAGCLARRLRLDILHDPSANAPFLFLPRRIRTVLTVHDVIPCIQPEYSTLAERWLYRYWLPARIRRTDAVITVSRLSRREIETSFPVRPDRITVLPLGVSSAFHVIPRAEVSAFLKGRYSIEGPYLFYSGTISKRKNIGSLLQAFRMLRPAHPDLRLVVAGPHGLFSLDPEDRRLADSMAGSLLMTGPVTDSELAFLYNGASVFVFPSLLEGFGLPPLEALACGTPVVCTKTGWFAEAAQDAVTLVDAGDSGSLRDAIAGLLDSGSRREQLVERGLVVARECTWERTAAGTLDVYRGLMASLADGSHG